MSTALCPPGADSAAGRLMHRIADDVTRLGIGSGAVDFEISLVATGRRGPSVLKGART